MRAGLRRSPIFLLCWAMLGSGCDTGEVPSSRKATEARPIVVQTLRIQPKPLDRTYRVPGSVVAEDRVQISSRISGFIQSVKVREGDRVSSGQVLVEIDPSEVLGRISQAGAVLQSAEADRRDAQRDVGKFSELAEQGGIPEDTLRKARVRLQVAESRVAEATAALQTAEAQKRYSRITSPVAGVITERNLQPGDLATPGHPILAVESQQSLLFQTFVAEQRVANLEIGQPVEVILDALDAPLTGSVLRIVPSGDPVTRRYEVKVLLPGSAGLLPGMFGRASFTVGREPAILVPISSLIELGGLTGVYVVGTTYHGGEAKQPVARFRWLRLRQGHDDEVEVTAGLESGDRLILSPPAALTEGAPVLPGPDDSD